MQAEAAFIRLLIAVVLACGLWPVVAAILRAAPSRILRLGTIAAWLAACSVVLFIRTETPAAIVDRPIEVADAEYVTSDTCRACHPTQYASWHDSYHRTMTRLATPETVKGDFNNKRVTYAGFDLLLHREGDRFMATPLDAAGDATGPGREIKMITGSHHMQIYWAASGDSRKMMLFPYVYLLEERRWITRDGAFLEPPNEAQTFGPGKWNLVCIQCHTTHGQPRIDPEDNMDTHVGEFGIACEACHGPAHDHVRLNRSPGRRYGLHFDDESDDSVVNPTKLPPKKASQVCGQCHSIFLLKDDEMLRRWNVEGFLYRPGDELSDTRLVIRGYQDDLHPALQREMQRSPHTFEDRYWSDGMARVSGREYNGLIESPCYTHDDEAAGILTCFSCHALHRRADDPRTPREWADDQLAAGMETNAACLQCHEDYATTDRLTQHTHHEPDSSGSLCYNCHMPYTTYGLLKALRSHQIDSPSTQATLETGRPNACNQCHLDRPLGWVAEKLSEQYDIPVPPMTAEEQEVSAAVTWLLRGDAGQRALAAWSLGWEPARRASGTDWMPPYLAQLLVDPYDAVRFIAWRSLRDLPDVQQPEYDFLGPAEESLRVSEAVRNRWAARPRALDHPAREAVLYDETGRLRDDRFEHLLEQRNDRRVNLAE